MEVGGVHSDLFKVRTHGIDHQLKMELDVMLEAGMSAGKVLNKLQMKYLHDVEMMKKLPTSQQISNRKATINRKKKEGRSIDSSAKFLAAAQEIHVSSKQDLEEKGDHDMIVLDIQIDDTGDATSYPTVFTSKARMKNMPNAYHGQKKE